MATSSVKDQILKLRDEWEKLKSTSYYKTNGYLKIQDIEDYVDDYLSICEEAKAKEKKFLVWIIEKNVFDYYCDVMDTNDMGCTTCNNNPNSAFDKNFAKNQKEKSKKAIASLVDKLKKLNAWNKKVQIHIPSLSNSNGDAYIHVLRIKSPRSKKLLIIIHGNLITPPPESNENNLEEAKSSAQQDNCVIKTFKLFNAILHIRLPTHITDIDELNMNTALHI